MAIEKKDVQKYIDKAANLAESVKRNIQHNSIIDDKTVIALNEFIIISNELSDLLKDINKDKVTYN